MAERFDISDDYIISFLRDIEEKVHRTDHSQYPLPHYIGGEIPVAALNNEAKKMMDFVGLTAFTPDCCWEETSYKTGGYIELDGSRFGKVKIHLSTRYKNNGNATIAILAHEICHKLLEYHGLYFPEQELVWKNEVYTDLCTIYVGFTQMIVNGYKTTVGDVTFELGYLTHSTFEQTISIVELVQGRRAFESKWASGIDAYSLLAHWVIDPDKRKCHLEGFARRQSVYSALNKRVTLLNRLLKEILASYSSELKNIDYLYFGENPSYGDAESVAKMPFTLFCMSHPELFDQSDKLTVQDIRKLTERLDEVIRGLIGNSKSGKSELFRANVHTCPFCGNEFSMPCDGRRWKVIKCKKCGNRFALDMTDYRLPQEDEPQVQPETDTEMTEEPSKKWWQIWK